MAKVENSWMLEASPRPSDGQPLIEICFLYIENKVCEGDLRGKLRIDDGRETDFVEFCFPGQNPYEAAKKKRKVDDLRDSLEVTDGGEKQRIDIFRADQSRSKSAGVLGPEFARLTGPKRAISALDGVSIALEFEDEAMPDKGGLPVPWIIWSPYDSQNIYYEPEYADMSCRYGDITMMYMVMKDALEVYVEMSLRSEKALAKIHGKICAQTAVGEVVLFEKDAGEGIKVPPEVPIPLSRRVICVPMNSKLGIEAHVQKSDRHPSSYKEIVSGCAELDPEVYEERKAKIKEANGEIEVKIAWVPFLCRSVWKRLHRLGFESVKASPPCAG